MHGVKYLRWFVSAQTSLLDPEVPMLFINLDWFGIHLNALNSVTSANVKNYMKSMWGREEEVANDDNEEDDDDVMMMMVLL